MEDPFADVIPDLTGTAFFAALLTPSATQQPASTATLPAGPTQTALPSELPVTATPTTASVPTLEGKARNGPLIQSIFVSVPPVLDGNFNDWSSPAYPAEFVVYGSSQWGGKNDLSASVQVSWDDQNFYLAAKIQDDNYVQTASGENIFKGDSLELLVDTKLQTDLYVSSLSPDDFQLGISAGSPLPGQAVETYLWFPASLSGKRNTIQVGAVQIQSGYQVEASIPWTIFDISPIPGLELGFAFSVSDNDLSGQAAQQSMVSTVPGRQLSDPTTWGNLVLVK